MRQVAWHGGPQDGAVLVVPEGTRWVAFIETPAMYWDPANNDAPPPLAIHWRVPIVDDLIMWSSRQEVDR